jgi:signal peptidase II
MLYFFKQKKFFWIGLFIAFIVACSDLWLKKIIFNFLEINKNDNYQITSFFNLVKVWNKGVSFGMFNQLENSWIIFSILQFSIALFLIIWLFLNKIKHVSIALGMIIGGAFGNSIDRFFHGAVADFLDFHIFSYHWPAFNLADSFVFIGVAILLFDDFILKKRND